MKKNIFSSLLIVFVAFFCFFCGQQNVHGENFVPESYQPNYHITKEREELLDLIIEIRASDKVGTSIPSSYFLKLHAIFLKIFTYFPSSPENKLLYRQCELTTKKLANEVTKNDYSIFKERCFSPIGELIKNVQTNYTVKANISAKPSAGSAPLNVTFDARSSKDPSSDTIPSENFFWYYKDTYGNDRVIGKGQVVNYTFEEPGNHIIHLTVRSANNRAEGIFDGTKNIAINVAPKSADIVVRINNNVLTTDSVFRIGTHEVKKGILIDGTSTQPLGARTIIKYERNITSSENNYTFKKTGKGNPGQFVHQFPYNGKYFISLSLTDNENNSLVEKYEISVSDPVASFRMKPDEGSTSDEYSFDASPSYSLTSRVKKYTWLIRNPEGKEEIVESKKIKRKFSIPGNYTVKLTVSDELGNNSYDELHFYVKSTAPIPSFVITPTSSLKNPSEFIFDASATFDADMLHGNDELSYDRSIAPNDGVTIKPLEDNKKRINVIFDKVSKYTITLRVNDRYGESVEIKKDIQVDSVLRPTIYVNPIVTKWGEEITFTAKVNKPVAFYERDFGDGKKQKSDGMIVNHTYKKAGIYNVSLHVVNHKREENIIEDQVFIGQKDMPTAAYEVKINQKNILHPLDTCPGTNGDIVPAYDVDRYQKFSFDAQKSLNVQGTISDIKITLHPKNDEVFAKSSMNYNFLEIGCHYIDVFVEDSNVGKTDVARVWFNVKNAKPLLDNLLVDFPQVNTASSSSMTPLGVGNNPLGNSGKGVLSALERDPIFAHVQAKGAKDVDGFISHYAWYYYETKNPDNILALKVTPSSINYTTFVIPKPRYAAEYSFAVRMVDNDGAETTSEEILGKGPVVFFPPGENNLDVPIVTLKTSVGYAKVGEEVTFLTESEVLSKRPDFETERYFKYDFDGDGEYDMTTKKASVKYIYQKSGEKHPKVAVFYKGRAGVGISAKVVVQKGLKPLLLLDSFDNKIIGKDISIGDVDTHDLCLDIKKCRKDDHRVLHDTTSFLFSYDEYGQHKMRYNLLDIYGNEQREKYTIDLLKERVRGQLGMLSIPPMLEKNEKFLIEVGNSLNNTVSFLIDYKDGACYGDLDITVDSDNNGDPTDDIDVQCNKLYDMAFSPTKAEQVGKIYYAWKGEIQTKNITISFIDFEEVVNEKYKAYYPRIQKLLDMTGEENENTIYYKNLLVNLKATLGETNNMDSILVQLRQLINEGGAFLPESQKQDTIALIFDLSDGNVTEVLGGGVYDQAKINILAWFDEKTKEQVAIIFKNFEDSEGISPDERKKILDEIIRIAAKAKKEGDLDITDYNYIQKNLCDIVVYYKFSSKTCGTAVEIGENVEVTGGGTESKSSTKSSSIGSKILRGVIIVAIILALIFGGLVVFFAIKSRKKGHEADDSEGDEDDIE